MSFMDAGFLLSGETARKLYDQTAGMPIFDYHNHLNPQEIVENKNYGSVTSMWLARDHYKWRILRAAGAPERCICGEADDREKFRAFAAACEKAIGSPVYYWTNLELQRLFGAEEPLTRQSADRLYELCNRRLQQEDLRPRELLRKLKVRVLCTTEAPDSALEWHRAFARRADAGLRMSPGFRPDGVLHIGKPGWADSVKKLLAAEEVREESLDGLEAALDAALDRFKELGCFTSDHGFERFAYRPAGKEEARAAFRQALRGETLTQEQQDGYVGYLLGALAALYHSRGIVMQLHLGALRDANTRGFARLGPDSGYDSVGRATDPFALAAFLDALAQRDQLPELILYCLNPCDYPVLATVCATFGGGRPGRVQLGAAWWFNDTERGIREQLQYLFENGMFAYAPGMLTDSRSIGSFVRHEYYRRIVCDEVGALLDSGRYHSFDTAQGMLEDVFYNNAERLFIR